MIALIIVLTVYIISFMWCLHFVSLMHNHPEGREYDYRSDLGEMTALSFCPIANTCCVFIFIAWRKDKYAKGPGRLQKFINIFS